MLTGDEQAIRDLHFGHSVPDRRPVLHSSLQPARTLPTRPTSIIIFSVSSSSLQEAGRSISASSLLPNSSFVRPSLSSWSLQPTLLNPDSYYERNRTFTNQPALAFQPSSLFLHYSRRVSLSALHLIVIPIYARLLAFISLIFHHLCIHVLSSSRLTCIDRNLLLLPESLTIWSSRE